MSVARVFILAEERLLARGLASLLRPGFETHALESLDDADPEHADSDRERVEIALWLGDRLDRAAVDQLEDLKLRHPGLRFCLLARAADADALDPLVRDGAHGVAVLFRSRELDVAQVVASLDVVLAERATLEPSVLARLIAVEGDDQDALACLTDLEREVLELVAEGLRNREIARRIWKSEKAVEKQVSHVFQKLRLDQDTACYLDRRVAAARIFFACRPQSVATEPPGAPLGGAPAQLSPATRR